MKKTTVTRFAVHFALYGSAIALGIVLCAWIGWANADEATSAAKQCKETVALLTPANDITLQATECEPGTRMHTSVVRLGNDDKVRLEVRCLCFERREPMAHDNSDAGAQ